MKKKLKVVVDRKKWLRGGGWYSGGALCTHNNRKCCLGFATNQLCNVPYSILKDSDTGSPKEFFETSEENYNRINEKIIISIEDEAIDINDSEEIKGKEREKRLKKIFAKAGITLIFKN